MKHQKEQIKSMLIYQLESFLWGIFSFKKQPLKDLKNF